MALQIDPQSIASHIAPATYRRGLQIYLNQGVLEHTLEAANAGEWHVHGRVRGSEPVPHDTHIVLEIAEGGHVHAFDATCSCSVGADCKHAVALALKAAYRSGTVLRSAVPDRAPEHPRSQPNIQARPAVPRSVAELNQWLHLFEPASAAQPASSASRPGPADIPIYLLSDAPRNPQEPQRLLLSWRVSRMLKRGGWAKPKAPGYDAWYRLPALTSADANDDRDCIRLIQSLGNQRHSYGDTSNGVLEGTAGALALELAARTGRLYVAGSPGQIEGEPLRWAPPRHLQWHWNELTQTREAESLWALRAGLATETTSGEAAATAAPARVYGSQPALYVDANSGTCGLVEHSGIEQPHLRLLLSAPPIPQSAFADPQTRLLERLAGLPLPPTVREPEAWPAVRPSACLALAPVPRAERVRRGLLSATLAFDYAGLRGRWTDTRAHVLAAHAGRAVLLRRDPGAEHDAQARLNDFGLAGDAEGRYHAPEPMLWLEWATQDWAPLRGAGFVVEAGPALADFVQCADDLLVAVAAPEQAGEDADDGLPEAATASWFDLSLGIEIAGQRHNVLPWLPGLLAQVRLTADGPQLPQWLWREQPDGRWLRLPSAPLKPWLQALLELVSDRPAGDLEAEALRLSRLEALRMGVMLGEGAVWDGAAGLRELLHTLAGNGAVPAVPVPSGLQAQLRPYQQQGLDWLQFLRRAGLGGILADDMGLGKTLQALAHLLRDQEDGLLDRPSLVIVPVSLLGNWRREAERFAPTLRAQVWHGTERHGRDFAGCDLVIAPYSLLQRDRERWQRQRWHVVMLDEAQQIKNASTQAAQVVATFDARQRLCLTGTPMENHLGELWSLFHFLMPGFLGSQARFREVFRLPIEKQGDAQRLAQLRQRVTPFMLRRTKSAVATELPDRIESTTPVTLDGAQADLHETIRLATEKAVREALEGKGLARSQIQVLDALLKLRQVCCDPRLVKSVSAASKVARSAKLELLMELLPEMLEERRRVLLFSQFTSMLALIEDALRERKLKWAKLTGQTRERDAEIARFTRGEVPLFLISLKAGGTGLNLPEADTVIHYDPWWNPAVEEQATARAHRIGQQRQVMVYKLVAEGTIEERVLALQARKAALTQGLLHGAAARKAPLFTEEDVAELLRPIG